MLIQDISKQRVDGLMQAHATVLWEDLDRKPDLVFAGVDSQFDAIISPDANGFLLAALVPAWQAGEQRVRVEGTLCPVLTANVRAALATLQLWFPELGRPPVIESSKGFAVRVANADSAGACFLSYGIESVFALVA
jgi:hypothetical protein